MVRTSRTNFSANLTRLMDERGLSDAELARKLTELGNKKTGMTISRWRSGETEPSYEDKDNLATIFGISVSALYADPTDQRTVQLPIGAFYDAATQIVVDALKKAKEGLK